MNNQPQLNDKRRKYSNKTTNVKAIVITVLCIAIVSVWILTGFAACKLAKKHSDTDDVSDTAKQSTSAETESAFPAEQGSFYENSKENETLTIDKSQIYSGSLIVVTNDEDRAYRAVDEEFVNVLNTKTEINPKPYKVSTDKHRLHKDAFYAFEEMLGEFYNTNGRNRNFQLRLALFDEPSENCSEEHLTGYAVDVNVFDGKASYTLKKDAPAQYNWIYDHAPEYGFVLSYPDTDNDHFRYVGKGHAMYINENAISLEEYIGQLQRHVYGEKHMMFTYGGVEYECFYVYLGGETESVDIEIPSGVEYTLSGDNVSGVIVTLYR